MHVTVFEHCLLYVCVYCFITLHTSSTTILVIVGVMIKKKVYIPNREHPDVNFLGLLIGPRGRSQKELEARTGARILIRGRGSQKGGDYSGPSGNPNDDDEQHVSIEGTEEAVAKAQAEVGGYVSVNISLLVVSSTELIKYMFSLSFSFSLPFSFSLAVVVMIHVFTYRWKMCCLTRKRRSRSRTSSCVP
jgi:hypothetical protein